MHPVKLTLISGATLQSREDDADNTIGIILSTVNHETKENLKGRMPSWAKSKDGNVEPF